MNKPYFLSSEGVANGVYIRVGRSTLRADRTTTQELEWQSRGLSFDALPCHAVDTAGFETSLIAELFPGKRVPEEKERINILKSFRVIVSEHGKDFSTHGGALLFDPHPQRFHSEAFIICSMFKGNSGREV